VNRLARLTVAGILVAAAPSWAGDVQVSFSKGLVTIVAIEATPRQILMEWSRQGQVRIANLDRLSGGPVTLQMIGVPEAQALETLLRGTAGYVAAPRAEPMAAGSSYDRILLMPGVAPAIPASRATSAPMTDTDFGRGRQSGRTLLEPNSDGDSDAAWAAPGMGQGAERGLTRPDQDRQAGPGQIVMPGARTPAPIYSPGMPNPQPTVTGASTPGVLTAPPQPPPGQTAGAPGSSGRTLVVNPAANPFGLPNPVKPPTTTPPPGPIKKPGAAERQS
jgi:hypothetical protein